MPGKSTTAAGIPTIKFFDAKKYISDVFQLNKAYKLELCNERLSQKNVEETKGSKIICIFVNDEITEAMVPKLKENGVELVLLRCNGYNNVPLKALTNAGISVTRVPNYSPYAVAEHAIALLLTVNRKIHRAASKVSHGDFSLDGLVGWDLHGAIAGVLGTGKIGQCLINILLGFGMKVLCYDVYRNPELLKNPLIEYKDTIDEVLAEADVISLHLPLLDTTKNIINAKTIAKCKKGITIINTSRGALIDSEALIDGIRSGQIGAAGLDVYAGESEIFFEDNREVGIVDDALARLVSMPQVVVTGHQAFLTREALKTIADTSLTSADEFMAGKRLSELTYSCNDM